MCFLPLKSSHYPSRPVPVPELFGKYPTRPVPKSKTPTRQTLLIKHTFLWPYLAPRNMIIGSLCHYLHIDGIVCASTCPLTLGANTWGIFIFFGKVVSLSFDSKLVRATSITNIDIYMEFIWHLPEILVFPSKMNVDLKFVFRSIVQVYQRFKDI